MAAVVSGAPPAVAPMQLDYRIGLHAPPAALSPMARSSAEIDASLDRLKRNLDIRRWRVDTFSHAAGVQRRADIIVRSADGHPYPSRRLHLAYGSDVFADLLATCGEGPESEDQLEGKLKVIQMDEKAEDGLDVFMSLVTPGAAYAAPRWGIDNLLSALKLADKLDSSVLRLSLPYALEPYLPSHAALIFAHAVVVQHFALARLALSQFHAELVYEERDEYPAYVAEDWLWSPPPKVTTAVSGRVVRVSDIPEDLACHFPLGLYCQLVRSQERLLVDWRTYRPAEFLLEFEAAWDAIYPNTRT